MDLLDPSAGQAVLSKRPKLKARRPKEGSTGGFEVDENTGRIIIVDPEEQKGKEKEKMGSSSKLQRIIFWASQYCIFKISCVVVFAEYFASTASFFVFFLT